MGKTEAMLFKTTKLLKTTGEIDVLYNNQRVNFTETYKYLRNIGDHHLNFIIWSSYGKANSRLHLLEWMRCHLTLKAAQLVYIMMIIPLLTSSD